MNDHGYYKITSPLARNTAVLTDKLSASKRWKTCRSCGAKGVYADPQLGHRPCIECGAEHRGPRKESK